ncbi:MAG: ATP synthase F1 subunit delta [Clostridia bacterium]
MAEIRERYARALFEILTEEGKPKKHQEEVVLVCNALQCEKCANFLQHPSISDADKKEFLHNVFGGKISEDLMGFLHLAIAKNREKVIVPSLSLCIDMLKEHNGEVVANVVSASELNKTQVARLKRTLSQKLDKKVEVVAEVDASLIGGLYIKVENRLIDFSLRTRLSKLKESMERGIAE